MLPRKERLSRDVFGRFFASGKRFRAVSFDVIYTPHETFHASIVVSKKVAPRAVLRNKLRRRIYSLLRTIGAAQGVYIVVMRRTEKPVEGTTLRNELVRAIRALNM